MTVAHNPSSHTDIAALAAAVVAVTVSLFLDEGLYGLISLIVSLVLIVIIVAFVGPNKRTFFQSLALAASLGLAAIPGVGFIIETYYAPERIEFLFRQDPLKERECVSRSKYYKMGKDERSRNYSCNHKHESDSKVEQWTAGATWLIVLLGALVADLWWWQPRRRN